MQTVCVICDTLRELRDEVAKEAEKTANWQGHALAYQLRLTEAMQFLALVQTMTGLNLESYDHLVTIVINIRFALSMVELDCRKTLNVTRAARNLPLFTPELLEHRRQREVAQAVRLIASSAQQLRDFYCDPRHGEWGTLREATARKAGR